MANLHLKIITPRKVVLEDDVSSVTAPSVEGEITVLPHHVRLFSLLQTGIVKIKKNNLEDQLAIGAGYLQTDGDEINILVSKAYGQEGIDEELTKKAMEDAKKILGTSKDREERNKAISTLRHSIIDMKLLRRRKRARGKL